MPDPAPVRAARRTIQPRSTAMPSPPPGPPEVCGWALSVKAKNFDTKPIFHANEGAKSSQEQVDGLCEGWKNLRFALKVVLVQFRVAQHSIVTCVT